MLEAIGKNLFYPYNTGDSCAVAGEGLQRKFKILQGIQAAGGVGTQGGGLKP